MSVVAIAMGIACTCVLACSGDRDRPPTAIVSSVPGVVARPSATTAIVAPPPLPPPAPEPPLVGMTRGYDNLTCDAPRSCRVKFSDMTGRIYVEAGSAGMRVEAMGSSVTVPSRGIRPGHSIALENVNWAPVLDTAPLGIFVRQDGAGSLGVTDPAEQRRRVHIPVVVRFPDGGTASGSLPTTASNLFGTVYETLSQVRRGPVPWPTEGTGNALIDLTRIVGGAPAIFGAAASWGDIGRVALNESTTQNGNCGTYRGAAGTQTLRRSASTWVFTIHDRRTGRVLATRTFASEMPPCPTTTVSQSLTAAPDREAAIAWLREQASGR